MVATRMWLRSTLSNCARNLRPLAQVRQMYFIRYFGVMLALAIGFVVATSFLVVNLGLPTLLLAADRVTVTYKVTATVRVNGELRSGSSLQQGIISVAAREIATAAGLDYVEDACTAVIRAIEQLSRRV